jgi:hypothetical protein
MPKHAVLNAPRAARARPLQAAWIEPALDASAIVVFVTIGLISHRHGFAQGYARDLPPFLGCWLSIGLLVGLYREGGRRRLVLTWLVSVPVAVLVRALAFGRPLNGSEAAFLLVSVLTIGALVGSARLLLSLAATRMRPAASQ